MTPENEVPAAPAGPSRATVGAVGALPAAIGLLVGAMDAGDGTPGVDPTPASAAPITNPLTTTVGGQDLRVFFGNLHSHTSLSDGSGFPEEAYRFAENAGLDFLAITEHNHDAAENRTPGTPIGERGDGVLIGDDPSLYVGPDDQAVIPAADRMNDDDGFIAIYGQEFSSIGSGNHANVFFAPDVIDARNGRFDELVTWLDQNRDVMGQRPVVQFNHPQLHSGNNEYGGDDFGDRDGWLAAMDPVSSLIEIANGPHTGTGTGNTPTTMQNHYLAYLNEGFHLAPTADQDNHERTWGSVTEARTGVVASRLTRGDLLGAFRSRHVYATLDRNLQVIATVNGRLMGDVIRTEPAVGDPLDIRLHVRDADEPDATYRVDVFVDDTADPDGDRADSVDTFVFQGDTPATDPFVISDVTYSGPGQYLFLKVEQVEEHGDDDLAWTAPVWFESGDGPGPGDAEPSARIVSLLPNPVGDELQNEAATIRNDGPGPVDLSGWVLQDLAGREWSLDELGTIPPNDERTIQRNGQPMAMNNSGQETIALLDPNGRTIDAVTYSGTTEGQPIRP